MPSMQQVYNLQAANVGMLVHDDFALQPRAVAVCVPLTNGGLNVLPIGLSVLATPSD